LNHGVDGYRVDAVPFLFENQEFLDDTRKPEEMASKEKNTHEQYYHEHTMDLPETFDMISQFREVVDEYTKRDGKTRYLIKLDYSAIIRKLSRTDEALEIVIINRFQSIIGSKKRPF